MNRKYDLVRALWEGRVHEASAAGLRSISCATPGCQAVDYYLEGDNRDQRRAARWAASHKKHLKG